MNRLRAQALLVIGLPLLLMLLTLIGGWQIELATEQESNLAVLSDARRYNTELLLLRLVDSETGVRGYAATHNRRFLDPYTAALSIIPKLVASLRAHRVNVQARSEADAIARATESQMRLLSHIRSNLDRGKTSVLPAELLHGKANMDAIRVLVERFGSTERALNDARRVRAAADQERLRYALGATLLLAIAAGIASIFLFTSRVVRRLTAVIAKTEDVAADRALGPPIGGGDEIADVDRAVYQMATAIRTERSERRHAAEQISLGLQRYHMLANATSDIIIFLDRAELVIVDANAAALAAYGYERADFIGQPLMLLRPPGDVINPDHIALADSPSGFSSEQVHRRSDGTLFPVEVHAHTSDVDGRRMVVATLRDISERRRAAELVALALDDAIEASRLKSEFVATMSHEIRTPMHGVIGMSELLLETPLNSAQREYAVTVKDSAQALLAIIDDILDFSKLEANKLELELVPFDPVRLVASAINLARGTARDKGLVLRSRTSPNVPTAVRGDPTRLRQVLINLIGNAVKFTACGEVTVTISVERDDERATVLSFCVSDTGIGVSPEARDRLFEAFVQGDGSTTRRFGGTGLGLSISRRLVDLMDGRIWLGEHEGPGATFCFTARFERTSEVAAPVVHANGALRVLVLADDPAARRIFEGTLAGWGMQNAAAGDVDSARTQLRDAVRNSTPFDVVLLDYVLFRDDGLAFAAELCDRAEYGDPARILVTAFDAAGRKEAALAAGCSAYLVKPVDPSDLLVALGNIEHAHKLRASANGSGLSPARILMAEDSALIRRVAGLQLKELEYAVDIVENGTQVVEAVANGNYQLVLMDMRMPEMDGLDATRAIREAERTSGRHIVVIALTANVLEGDREACLVAGMDDFLAKPLKLDALRAALERWLPEATGRG